MGTNDQPLPALSSLKTELFEMGMCEMKRDSNQGGNFQYPDSDLVRKYKKDQIFELWIGLFQSDQKP